MFNLSMEYSRRRRERELLVRTVEAQQALIEAFKREVAACGRLIESQKALLLSYGWKDLRPSAPENRHG